MGKLLSWLGKYVGLRRNSCFEDHELAMRTAWTTAAGQLGLVCSVGKTIYDDQITGMLDNLRVRVFNEFDVGVQKLVTVIRVSSESALSRTQNLDRPGLLAAYDQSVQRTGKVAGDYLSEDARACFLGHRRGIGAECAGGVLLYRQLFGIDDAAEITLVTRALTLTMWQLANRRPSGA